CWGGLNTDPTQQGGNNFGSTPFLISEDNDWATISAGTRHSCATKQNGTAYCIGSNFSGALGISDETLSTDSLLQSTSANNWASIAASRSSHTCAVNFSGELSCWGYNNIGQLGDNTQTSRFEAMPTYLNSDEWLSVSAGGSFTCGLDVKDDFFCWGSNNYGTPYEEIFYGKLGLGRSTVALLPVQEQYKTMDWKMVVSADGYNDFSAYNHSCGIKANGTLWCWGISGDPLGLGSNIGTQYSPIQVMSSKTDWSLLDTNRNHTCAIDSEKFLWCWGRNNYGQLGSGESGALTSKNVPELVDNLRNWTQISTGDVHSCGIDELKQLFCWGRNQSGQLGIGQNETQVFSTPMIVDESSTWETVSTGGDYTCGIKTDGSLWCWGDNYNGQLGNGNSGEILYTPQKIGEATNWMSIALSMEHSCGIQNDKSLWCWGSNFYGEIGDNSDSGNVRIPTQINPTELDWLSVNTGDNNTCAVKTDNSMWCWGENHLGQLGNNDHTFTTQSIPVEVTSNNDWKYISVGSVQACGIKLDNTLWCWGDNLNGELGFDYFKALVPTKVDFNSIGSPAFPDYFYFGA
ncbi:MAG: hypothetical protein OEX19_08670, partial [Gammaproteobacteria bacterium]|nr:hypothetical protein [Gammaproteobacteria bacterium]